MPPGRGKKYVRSTFSAADYALLKVEATQRKTSVNELVHSAINTWLNPEKRERGILLTHMETLSEHLSTLVPELQALERATVRTEGLSRALDSLRSDQKRAQDHTTQAIHTLANRLDAQADAQWRRQLRYLYAPLVGAMLLLFGLLVSALYRHWW